VYADFRLIEYPDLETGAAVYTLAREDNLIDRGNCESATAPMLLGETVPALSNATFVRSADFAHGGTYSYKITKTVAAGTVGLVYLDDAAIAASTADMHGLVAGETYEYSFWVYVPTASGIDVSEIDLICRNYKASAADWSTVEDSAAPTALDTWQKISGEFTLDTDATGFVIYFRAASAAADTEYFHVDDIRLTAHTVPGSHYLSSGYIETLCPMTEKFTLQIKFKPTFAYDTASNQPLFSWYVDANSYFLCQYQQANDVFWLRWYDGGTERLLASAQYDNGAAFRNVNQWITLTAAIDLSTGSTAGSALWMDKTQDDTAWSGNIDAKVTEFNKLQIRAYNGTAGAYDIAYVRLFPNLVATDAQVQNDFKDVENEEIFWCLDGHGTGRTRANITRFVRSITTTKNVENPANGAQTASIASFSLNNTAGEFSDDQYAAYAPESDQFNGLVTQKYLQKRSGITIENWYGGDFDTVFFGKLTGGGYTRQTDNDKFGVVYCSAEDYVGLIARKTVRRGRYWENADLVDTATETDSLLHLITRLATKKEVYNYLPDASFDSSAPTNSWTASSTDVAIARSTSYSLFGNNSGQITYTVPGQAYATVTYTGKKKLNVGETWTFYGWLQSTAAKSDTDNRVYLSEESSSGSIDLTAAAYTLTGVEGFKKFEVTHTITSSGSDRLACYISGSTGDIIRPDAVHLIVGDRALNYFVANDNTGASGIEAATDADYDSYDTIGFDVQSVAITHPWRRVEANESLWDYVKDLSNATVARSGLNSAGTFRYRSRLSSDYSDPVPMGTLTETMGVAVETETQEANRVVVHGANFVKHGGTKIMWDAQASNVWALSTENTLSESVSTGVTWPSTASYGNEFIAKYGESGEYPEEEKSSYTYNPPVKEYNHAYDGAADVYNFLFGWLWGK